MPPKPRKYQQKKRAAQQEDTRRRIVQATVELHTTLGPARTSILAIAERAGVERPTVYRHFPTNDALLTACSSHHWELYPPPDPEPWVAIADPDVRLRTAFGALYDYYTDRELAHWSILRDAEDVPDIRRFGTRTVQYRARVVDVLAAGARNASKRHRAALGHAIDFFAWRSLHRQGLSNAEAAELMVDLVRSA